VRERETIGVGAGTEGVGTFIAERGMTVGNYIKKRPGDKEKALS
jgi:hypothetical protein